MLISLVALQVLACSAVKAASISRELEPRATAPRYWFAFGDSYTATAFNPDGKQPTSGNPLGNPKIPEVDSVVGRPNWVQQGTTVYNQSEILTYNFAYGGATTDAALVAPSTSTIRTLTEQVDLFLSNIGKQPAAAPWTSGNALFTIWIGINDIGRSYTDDGDRQAFTDKLLTAQFELVQKLVRIYKAGARRFIFLNVPPLHRAPSNLGKKAAQLALLKDTVSRHNTKLSAKIANWKAIRDGVSISTVNIYGLFNPILDNPTASGFKDSTSFGEKGSFWGNNYHPTSAVHTIIIKKIVETIGGNGWF